MKKSTATILVLAAGGGALWWYLKNRSTTPAPTSATLANTAAGLPAPAAPVNVSGLTPVNASLATAVTPIPPNPFLGGNPFLPF